MDPSALSTINHPGNIQHTLQQINEDSVIIVGPDDLELCTEGSRFGLHLSIVDIKECVQFDCWFDSRSSAVELASFCFAQDGLAPRGHSKGSPVKRPTRPDSMGVEANVPEMFQPSLLDVRDS